MLNFTYSLPSLYFANDDQVRIPGLALVFSNACNDIINEIVSTIPDIYDFQRDTLFTFTSSM